MNIYSARPPGDTGTSSLRFLIAEDHEFQRGVITDLLRQLTAQEVYAVENGHSALKMLADETAPVDVLVLDLALPGMDGLEVLQALTRVSSKVAVILNSACDPELLGAVEVLAAEYNANVLGVIHKPLTIAKLRPLLKRFECSARCGATDGQGRFKSNVSGCQTPAGATST
jgi:CheY-like chemotaxis protein